MESSSLSLDGATPKFIFKKESKYTLIILYILSILRTYQQTRRRKDRRKKKKVLDSRQIFLYTTFSH